MSTSLQPYTDTFTSVHFSDTHALAFFEGIEDVYSYHVRDFTAWCRDHGHGVDFDAVREYFEALNGSDYAANTKRIKRQAVKRRIRQYMQNAPIDDQVRLDQLLRDLDRAGKANMPKIADTSVHADKVLSPTEIDRLLEGTRSRKQYFFIKFLYVTGCRVAEMCGVKKGHTERQGDRVKILVQGKGNKVREVIIPTELYDAIRSEFRGELYLFETRGCKAYATNYVSRQIANLGSAILNRKISAHTMRHSFATNGLKRGWKVEALSRYLGHSSVKITLDLYCHATMSYDDVLAFARELL